WVFQYDVDGKRRTPMQGGLNRQLTKEENKLIRGHLELMRKLARQRAVLDQSLMDPEDALWLHEEQLVKHNRVVVVEHSIFSDLEDIGLEVLEEQVGCWDPTSGLTFDTFVGPRIAAAMDNYLTFRRQQVRLLQQGVHPPDCVFCHGA